LEEAGNPVGRGDRARDEFGVVGTDARELALERGPGGGVEIVELQMQSERRLIDDAKPTDADGGDLRGQDVAHGKGLRLAQAHQYAALGNIGGLAADDGVAEVKI